MKVVNVVPVDQDWSCPICLNSMSQVNEIANPEVCNHHFCLKCLLEWSQTNTSCPLDRMDFRIIFVKNAVGGAIQRRVRTPQRDLRADLTEGESEDTEDDVEVTVANAVSNSLVVAANELMRNRLINATCPECRLTAGPDAAVCVGCNDAYHRQCARVRDARIDQWRCIRCRSQNPPVVQNRGRGRAVSNSSRGRRNALAVNDWHGEFLQLLGNRNYHSSEDDTYSYDSDQANAVAVSDDTMNSLTSESDVDLADLPRTWESLTPYGNHIRPDSDANDSSSRSDDNSDDSDSVYSEGMNTRPPRTRRTVGASPSASPRPAAEPVQPLPLRQDLFSQFSDSDSSDASFDPSEARRLHRHERSGSSSASDTQDGRRSRASHRRRPLRSDSNLSSHSERVSNASPPASWRGSDSDEDFVAASPKPPSRRRRARWDSNDSEEEEEEEEERWAPKRLRLAARATTTISRPRRRAAPVHLAEPFNDSLEEPRASSSRAPRARGGGARRTRGAANSSRPAGSSASNATARGAANSSRPAGSSASNAASRRATTSTRRASAGPSRGRRRGNSGSARTSARRKKSSVRRRSSPKKRKTSVKMRGGGPQGALKSSSEEDESEGNSEGTEPAFEDGRSLHRPSEQRPSHRQLKEWFKAYSDSDSSTTAMTYSSTMSSIYSDGASFSNTSYSSDSSTD